MAWYALYKWFIPWRKKPYQNMISWYKRFLYYEWFNSLHEEGKIKEEQRISDLKAKREREGVEALEQLYLRINRMSGGRMNDIMKVVNAVNSMTIHSSRYW